MIEEEVKEEIDQEWNLQELFYPNDPSSYHLSSKTNPNPPTLIIHPPAQAPARQKGADNAGVSTAEPGLASHLEGSPDSAQPVPQPAGHGASDSLIGGWELLEAPASRKEKRYSQPAASLMGIWKLWYILLATVLIGPNTEDQLHSQQPCSC